MAIELRVPRDACRFTAPTTFAAKADAAEERPVSIHARTLTPVPHWYWGSIVHDFASMSVDREKIPMDWCHTDEILGDATHRLESDGLHLDARLVLATDRAKEVSALADAGIELQASIEHDYGFDAEILDNNQVATVNNQKVKGPALIVRNWSLRAVALCKLGADPKTQVAFEAGDIGQCRLTATPPEPVVRVELDTAQLATLKAEAEKQVAEVAAKLTAAEAAKTEAEKQVATLTAERDAARKRVTELGAEPVATFAAADKSDPQPSAFDRWRQFSFPNRN